MLTRDPWIEVRLAASDELSEPLVLLAEFLRDGKPVPPPFAEQFRGAVEEGYTEMLVAWIGDLLVGVAVLPYGLSVSSGVCFASVESLYVRPDARRRGVGRALLEAVEERCAARGISYVEVQTDDEAVSFYRAAGYELEPDVRVLSRAIAL